MREFERLNVNTMVSVIKTIDYSEKKTLIYNKDVILSLKQEAKYDTGNKLVITVYDNAGNVRRVTKTIYIDKTNPKLTVDGIENDTYYNNTATMDLTVQETIYKEAIVDISIKRAVDGKSAAFPLQKFILTGVTSKKTLTFSEEGHYLVTVQVTDKAKNKSQTITREFVVDKTPPKIEINGGSEKYNSRDVKLKVNVVESNYKNQIVNIEATRTYNGKKQKVNVTPLRGNAKNSSVQEVFQEDGDYIVKVTAQDKAGNKATMKTANFTVDKTSPKVVFTGVSEKQVTNKNISLKSVVTEINHLDDSTMVHVVKKDMDGVLEEIDTQNIAFNGAGASYDRVMKEEGIYYVTVIAEDKAKNKTKKRNHIYY